LYVAPIYCFNKINKSDISLILLMMRVMFWHGTLGEKNR